MLRFLKCRCVIMKSVDTIHNTCLIYPQFLASQHQFCDLGICAKSDRMCFVWSNATAYSFANQSQLQIRCIDSGQNCITFRLTQDHTSRRKSTLVDAKPNYSRCKSLLASLSPYYLAQVRASHVCQRMSMIVSAWP